ncbi:MAG: glutamine synthetase family protein, partial [Coriobacteriales bacterium]
DIHFIRLWFTDVLGNLKSMAVTNSEVDNALEVGMEFDGSSIPGFRKVQESDMMAFPIASTFQLLPWRPKDNGVARMFCEIRNPDGTPFEGDPRYVLKKTVEKAKSMGYTVNIGPELEYYYLESDKEPKPIDQAGYFDLTSADHASDLRRDTILTLENMSIPVEYSHHECSPSQQEIDLRFSDALSMADSVMTYRLVVKEIALLHGVYATFMPMPLEGYNGSGMHLHQSLFNENGDNVFYDSKDPYGMNLSKTAKHYIAGLLKYAPEYLMVTNQYVNSYKRLLSHKETSRFVCWSRSNRSALIRIPAYRMTDELASRVEIRVADPSANPYLAFAATISAGLKGIEEELELGDPLDGVNIADMSREEREAAGIAELPRTLSDALSVFEESEFMREVLGDHIFDYLVKAKREECDEYEKTVTEWELNRFLTVL